MRIFAGMTIEARARGALPAVFAGNLRPSYGLEMMEHSASSLSRLLAGKLESAARSKGGKRHVAKDRILPAESRRVRRTRARGHRQGHAHAFSQIPGFMAERGEAIRIRVRDGCPRERGAQPVVRAHAPRSRLA